MATSKLSVALTTAFVDVAGAAAATAGVTWQNTGAGAAAIAFTAAAPVAGDAVHILKPGATFYDKNGSAKVYAKAIDAVGATLAATAD